MEAIYEFEVKDMPVTVSVDATGESVHIEGPKICQPKSQIRYLPYKPDPSVLAEDPLSADLR